MHFFYFFLDFVDGIGDRFIDAVLRVERACECMVEVCHNLFLVHICQNSTNRFKKKDQKQSERVLKRRENLRPISFWLALESDGYRRGNYLR